MTRDPAVKRRFQTQSAYVQQLLLDVTSDRWDSYLESLEVDHASVRRAASRLKREKRTRHPLITLDGTDYSAEGKVEVFADCMERQFTVHEGVSDPVHTAEVENFLSDYFSQIGSEPQHYNIYQLPDLIPIRAVQRLSPATSLSPPVEHSENQHDPQNPKSR